MPPNSEIGSPTDWLKRAIGNYQIAQRYESGDYYEDLCFYCQQATEKAVKAVLIQRGIAYIKTHNIRLLLKLLPDNLSIPISDREAADISEYAASTRYPGDYEPISETDWKRAIEIAEKTLTWARKQINFDNANKDAY
ncbi:MAG: HEPN domain-containing protein [candidate division Zixibacteria bacterium]|nr:HEPN domain-containing protein [Candidatus Tariuqbacter arcticus]